MSTLQIIEIVITLLSAAIAVIVAKYHLPAATAAEVKKILDTANKDINTFMPGSAVSDISNIVDKLADCVLADKQTSSATDIEMTKNIITSILKELNVDVNYRTEHLITAVIQNKITSKNTPKG